MNMKIFGKKILIIIKDDIFYGSGGSFEPRFEVALTSTIVSDFLCPVTIVGWGGGLRFAYVSPSVCSSVRHALQYRVCVINSSHSFQWVF